ncbi:MAG: Gfo/Idh/MocA family oxidoreductase, partial [Candidatus Bathyarchaeia archaeon]
MASKRKAKLGVIGCGDVTTGERFGHLNYISELHRGGYLELAAVCDISEERAKAAGEKFKAPYYTDAEKMLSTDLDCVYIATPDYTHHVLGKLAAEHGKHFIVEKPMALTLPCCDLMINAAKKAGVYFEVAENYFRTPNERVMKMAIQQGLIGDVLRVYVIPGSMRIAGRAATRDFCWLINGTISLHDMGVHQMSQLKNFAGSTPSVIRGVIQRGGKNNWPMWGSALVEFENGVVGITEISYDEGAGETPFRKIAGTRGCIYSYGIFCGAADMGGSMKILQKKETGEFHEVPIIKNVRVIGDKSYLDSIVVKSEPEITYVNPY